MGFSSGVGMRRRRRRLSLDWHNIFVVGIRGQNQVCSNYSCSDYLVLFWGVPPRLIRAANMFIRQGEVIANFSDIQMPETLDAAMSRKL